MSTPRYSFFFNLDVDEEIQIVYSIEDPDPDVGIRGGQIEEWIAVDERGSELPRYHFSKRTIADIEKAALADFKNKVEDNQADEAAYDFDTGDYRNEHQQSSAN